MDVNVILPFISGTSLSLGNLYLKKGLIQISSFNLINLLFNSSVIIGLIFGLIGALIFFYSLKILPLWMVIIVVNTSSIIFSIFFGVFVFKEFISPLKSILMILTIFSLIGVVIIK